MPRLLQLGWRDSRLTVPLHTVQVLRLLIGGILDAHRVADLAQILFSCAHILDDE